MTQTGRARPAAKLKSPSIADYAIIGDCRTAALISRQGGLDWLCLPHFSGPAVFAALLDRRRGGHFTVRPAGPFQTERRYLGETNVLETTFCAASGTLRVLDCMPILGGSGLEKGLRPANEILRIVECVRGEVEVVFEPRPDYARARARSKRVAARPGPAGSAISCSCCAPTCR